jgi:hypothetical protein
MDSLADLHWHNEIRVVVEPYTLDAPNIDKVVVTRDGQPVKPISEKLIPSRLSNLAGGSTTVNAGWVGFPTGAFAPGAEVEVIAIPSDPKYISLHHKLSAGELRRLK